jgi:hypothetical protein
MQHYADLWSLNRFEHLIRLSASVPCFNSECAAISDAVDRE